MKLLARVTLVFLLLCIDLTNPASAADVTVSHLIGKGGMGDTDGDVSKAKFIRPSDVALDSNGNIYVLDGNGIRKIDKSNQVTTIYKPSSGANSNSYCGITVDRDFNIWFADCRRTMLYKVSNSGLLLKSISLPFPQNSWLSYAPGVDALPDGSVLVSVWYDGKLLKVTPDGVVSTFYQSTVTANCNSGAKPAGIFCPISLTTTPSGEIYAISQGQSGNEILKISSSNVTKINGPSYVTNIEFANGALYVSGPDISNQQDWLLYKVLDSSSFQLIYRGRDPQRWSAVGFKFIDANTVLFPSVDSQVIRKINISSNTQTLIGNAIFGDDDGDVSKASITYPTGITEDKQGNIYFVDYKGIRKISPQGSVSTLYKPVNLMNSGLSYFNNKIYFIESNFIKTIDANGSIQQITNTNITGDYPYNTNNSMAINKNGDIYLVMYKNGESSTRFIRKFNANGGFKDLTPSFTNYADLKILFDKDDNLLIAYNGQIKKYNSDDLTFGSFYASFGGYSQFLSMNSRSEIFVFSRDQYSSILNIIKPTGVTENLISGTTDSSENLGAKSGFGYVSGILASESGNIYLTDSNNNSIRMVKYSSTSSSSSSSSGNSNTSVKLRSARSDSSWSRPSGLLPGLSEVRYRGYFKDNMQFFNDSAIRTSITSTSGKSLPNWRDSTEMGADISIYWGGYFIPDESGTWDFQLTSDDAAAVWLGNDAVSKYTNGYSNSLVALPGDHAPQTISKSSRLEANKIYPLRIFYGNIGGPGSFKLEVKPPSFKSAWDTNLEGLIWYSDFSNTEDCTNYGISYLLSAKLGYDIVDVAACKNNPAKVLANGNNFNNPAKPTFKSFNVTGNTLNLNVNIGTGTNKPEKVYLVAPELGINIGQSSANGKILGNGASWAIPITDAIFGKNLELKFISSKGGADSDPLVKSIAIPIKNNPKSISKNKNSLPPLPAINPRYSISGAKAVVTAKIQPKMGANPVSGYLIAPDIGITAENPIMGRISSGQIIFTMPLLPSMTGKKIKTEIYMVNEIGESKSLAMPITAPAPKQPTIVQPTQRVDTVICRKGIQTRTFAGKKCPPGWNE